ADANLLEVAEVDPRHTAARAEHEVGRVGRGAHPARRGHFTHPISSCRKTGKGKVAVAVRQRAGLAGIDRAVVVAVEEDGPAGQARLANILAAIAVDVVERLATDANLLEVAKSDPRDVAATTGGDIRGIE